ncbi:hypothetical protein CYMTET_28424 [Cymbomonas tetramitiformis]|uniref:Uncharacterized protein n=1 Tax=Cymbomonas tetramitiformis TaxID=36881 RepID=A0AAE0FMV6_9CHLO|nr:hypothetical protein CYMTET_28424 [Cymbomonas tetramitiformis]
MEMAKAVREFKRERLLQLNLARLEDAHPLDISDMKVNVTDFIRIFSRVWFSWSTPTDRITAWRKVGICQNFLAASEIDRSNFIVQDIEKHTSTAPPSVTEFKGSPLGVRKGSSEYYKRKIEAYKNLASAWETYETSPIEQGILNPEILPHPCLPKPTRVGSQITTGALSLTTFSGETVLSMRSNKLLVSTVSSPRCNEIWRERNEIHRPQLLLLPKHRLPLSCRLLGKSVEEVARALCYLLIWPECPVLFTR